MKLNLGVVRAHPSNVAQTLWARAQRKPTYRLRQCCSYVKRGSFLTVV